MVYLVACWELSEPLPCSLPSLHSLPKYTPPPPRLDPTDPLRVTDSTRSLGLVVCRGTQVTVICPEDELKEIPNPFTAEAEAEES